MKEMSRNGRAALRCVNRGWAVFPAHSIINGGCTCNKEDCASPGKHPRTANGLKDATLDPEQVLRWWERWPEANVAVATGDNSGICVLDVDQRNGGKESLKDLLRENRLPPTPTAKTGGGGLHLYFRYSKSAARSRSSICPGIDFKAKGGYVIGPPSVHKSGSSYAWLRGKTPKDITLAPLPPWVEEIAGNGNGNSKAIRSQKNPIETVPEGQRHDYLVRVAGVLRRQCLSAEEIEHVLVGINENRCDPPLPESEVIQIAQSAQAWEPGPTKSWQYSQSEDGSYWSKPTRDGETVPVKLTNFSARIVSDTEESDGVESRRSYEIEAKLHGRSRRFTVPAAQFPTMNWAAENLGAKAIVAPGMGLRDHARTAIQELSPEPEKRIVYTHSGWREYNNEWIFLHGAGAIGQNGLMPDVRVQLPTSLSPFRLPAPPVGVNLITAVRASMRLVELASPRITFPIFCGVWASVIGACDYALFLVGQTGAGKTEFAALHQQHFGSGFKSRNLPGSWSSTANANEALAFIAKDCLLVVDDFVAIGTTGDQAKCHKEADRLLRAQGNISGRGRMRSDATIRQSKTPRGLILSTGEDIPRGQSLRARIFVVELSPDDLDWAALTEAQRDAANGIYAQTMAAYLHWYAPRYEKKKQMLPATLAAWRNRANDSAQHRRTAETISHLQVGFCRFLEFAEKAGAIKNDEAKKLRNRCWKALGEAAAAQSRHQKSEDPVRRFLELIRSAISTGKAQLGDAATACTQNGKGDCIGWTSGDLVLLDPDRSFAIAQKLAQEQGEVISIGQKTLWTRMRDQGRLAKSDSDRNLVKTQVGDNRIRAVAIHRKTLGLASINRD